MNEFERLHYGPALSGLGIGASMVVGGAFGLVGRRRPRGHGPFEFDEYLPTDTLLVCVGLVLLVFGIVNLLPLLRHMARGRPLLTQSFLARAGMPRSVYELLLGVASADGRIDGGERAVVARVMTQELAESVTQQDLRNWSSTVEPPRDPAAVARRILPLLTAAERRNVLAWCAVVAGADGTDAAEHDVLRRVRDVLAPIEGLPDQRMRSIR